MIFYTLSFTSRSYPVWWVMQWHCPHLSWFWQCMCRFPDHSGSHSWSAACRRPIHIWKYQNMCPFIAGILIQSISQVESTQWACAVCPQQLHDLWNVYFLQLVSAWICIRMHTVKDNNGSDMPVFVQHFVLWPYFQTTVGKTDMVSNKLPNNQANRNMTLYDTEDKKISPNI